MIGNKLSLVKSVLILIILFSFGTVLGVIAYSATLKKTPPVAIQPTITPLYSSVPTPTPIPTTASKKLCAQSGDEQASCFSSYLSQNPIPDDIAKSDDKLKNYFSQNLDSLFFTGINRGKFDKYSDKEKVVLFFGLKNEDGDVALPVPVYIFIVQEGNNEKWQVSYQKTDSEPKVIANGMGGFEIIKNDPRQLVKNEPQFFMGAYDPIIVGTCVNMGISFNIYRLENNKFKNLWSAFTYSVDEGVYSKDPTEASKTNTTLIETKISFEDVDNDGSKEIIRQGTKKAWKGFCGGGSDKDAIKIDNIYEVYKWNSSKQTFVRIK